MATIDQRNNPCVQEVINQVIMTDDDWRAFYAQAANEGALGRPAAPMSKREYWTEAIFEYYVNGLLSHPKTQVINLVSNLYPVVTRPFETLTAATWDSVFGSPQDRVYFRSAVAEAAGMAEGSVDAFRFFASVLNNRATAYEQLLARQSLPAKLAEQAKIERTKRVINGDNIDNEILSRGVDILGSLINIPGGALTVGDLFYKIIHYRAQVYKDATNQAIQAERNAGHSTFGPAVAARKQAIIDGVFNSDASYRNFQDRAIADADERTYTKRPEGTLNQWMAGKGNEIGVIRWFVPFRRTLVNLVNYGWESTPLATAPALLGMETKTVKALKAGGALRSEAIGRMTVGTMVFAALTDSLGDLIDGDGPRNQQERALWEDNGHRRNTIRINEGRGIGGVLKHIPLDAFGPMSPLLMAYANTKDFLQQISTELDPDAQAKIDTVTTAFMTDVADAMLVAKTAATEYGQAMLDMHWFANISEVIQAFNNFKNSEEGSPKSILIYIDKMASSMVLPYSTLFKDMQKKVRAAAFDDNFKVDHNDWDSNPFSRTRHVLGLYTGLLPRQVGLWGDYMTNDVWLDPHYTDPVSGKDEVYEEIKRMNVHIPLSRREKMGVKLTPLEYEQFMVIAGRGTPGEPPLRDAVIHMMNSTLYTEKQHDEARAELITMVIQDYRDMASAYMFENNEELRQRLYAVQNQKEQMWQNR